MVVIVLYLTALLSLVFGLFGVFVTEWDTIIQKGFFQGYSLVVGVVICLQVCVCVCVHVFMCVCLYAFVCVCKLQCRNPKRTILDLQ